jgi:hypothetical protein
MGERRDMYPQSCSSQALGERTQVPRRSREAVEQEHTRGARSETEGPRISPKLARWAHETPP